MGNRCKNRTNKNTRKTANFASNYISDIKGRFFTQSVKNNQDLSFISEEILKDCIKFGKSLKF